MDLLMNGLLMAATLFAGGYCWVLARRVRDLKSLDKGLGGAIVTLTRQVELARLTLDEARASAKDTRHELTQLVARADGAAGQLRLLLAAVLATPAAAPEPPAPPPAPVKAMRPVPEPAPQAVPEPEPEPAPPEEPERPTARPGAPHLAEVPKPRVLAPIENPLRRLKPEIGAVRTEDDILEALSALAGGR